MEQYHHHRYRINGVIIRLDEMTQSQLEKLAMFTKDKITIAQANLGAIGIELAMRYSQDPDMQNKALIELFDEVNQMAPVQTSEQSSEQSSEHLESDWLLIIDAV